MEESALLHALLCRLIRRPKQPLSARAKAAGALSETRRFAQEQQEARLAVFVQASARLAAANEARYRAQMRTSHLVAPQDATSRYATHLRRPVSAQQVALTNRAYARELYMRSRTVVRADTRSEPQRQADRSAGELWRQSAELAVLSPATAATARHDPFVRSTAGAMVLLVAAEVVAEQAAAWTWRSVTVKTFTTKVVLNGVGQFAGNYLYTRDAGKSLSTINGLSMLASGVNMPLLTNSMWSAGFSLTYQDRFKSLPTGEITPYEFGRDAAFNYGFGQVAAGFPLPTGRSWVGLDNLHKTQALSQGVGFATYQSMLRLGPRFGYGVGLGMTSGLESSNKIATGAAKKYLGNEVKEQLPKKP